MVQLKLMDVVGYNNPVMPGLEMSSFGFRLRQSALKNKHQSYIGKIAKQAV